MTVPSPPRNWRLTWHIAAICGTVLAPLLVALGLLLAQLAETQHGARRAVAQAAAARAMAAVDQELVRLTTLLQILATRSDSTSAIPLPPGAALVLRDAGGRGRDGTAPQASGWRNGPPATVSGLVGGSVPGVRLAAPTPARDAWLTLDLPAEHLARLLHAAALPPGMAAILADPTGTVIARSNAPRHLPGPTIPDDLRLDPGERTDWREARGAAGEDVVLAQQRSAASDWWLTLLMPEPVFAAPLWAGSGTVLAWAAAGVLLLVAAAAWSARRITRPMRALAAAAGDPAAPRAQGRVAELNAVDQALADARAESATRLRQQEDLLLTLDRAPVLVRTLAGRILLWTAGAERLYGHAAADALDQVAHELTHTEFPTARTAVTAALLEHGEWHGELRQRRADGRTITVASHWALRRDPDGNPASVVEVGTDITALRDAEAALRRNRDLLASVLDASAEPIAARDREGRHVLLNRPAAALLGTTVEAAIGHTADDLLPPGAAARARATDDEVIATGETRVFETLLPGDADGPRTLVSSKAPWRDATGRIVGVVTVSRDISVRRRAQMRLQQLQKELLVASRFSAMGALAAELAHELNQPLTAVANFAAAAKRLLNEAPATEARLDSAREAMAEAADQALHAGRIVRGLRGFIGRGEHSRRPVPLGPLVEEAVRLAMAGSSQAGIQLELELDPAIPPVLVDRVQIQQVVVNLVRNALDAMQKTPGAEPRLVLRTSSGAQGQAELSVIDNGPGIEASVRDHLFEPFVTSKPDGMGIGLSICRSITEDHGGRLVVTPTPGGGATFRVTLPVAAAPALAAAE